MFEIRTIESGFFLADGGAMFGAIPKRAWKRRYTEVEDNLCCLAMRCLLGISADRKVLIDLGMGDKNLGKVSYYRPHKLKNIDNFLKKQDIEPKDITDVILTHLHFDHCGYATRYEDDRLVPSYPNATYWLSQKQWELYQSPNRLEKDAIWTENIQPIFDTGQLKLICEDTCISDTLRLNLYDGHSNGQIVVLMTSKDGIIAFPGDLIPTSKHISLDWISAYDINALSSLCAKERFLTEAVQGNYRLVYYHDSRIISSKVKQMNDNFVCFSMEVTKDD